MIRIRRIQKGESDLFKHMRLTSLHESPSAFATTYEAALTRSAESWREQADSTAEGSDRATFIAFTAASPIGIAALYRDPASMDTGEVLQVWVSPKHRGKGVAVYMMDAICRWAGENGFRRVLATVTQGNARALRFYRKYGFRLVREGSVDGPETLLIKELEVEQRTSRRQSDNA